MNGANQRATVTRIKSQQLIKAERELAALLAEPVPTDPEMRAYYDEACRLMQEAVNCFKHADALDAYMLRKFGPGPRTSSAEEIAP
jgi:hypothetical protein